MKKLLYTISWYILQTFHALVKSEKDQTLLLHRGISGPTKRTYVLQNFSKKPLLLHAQKKWNTLFVVLEAESQFYLAPNGTDSTSCGHNITTACRTFTWLLDVFYNESYLNNINLPRLSLVIATSFEIGPEILVRMIFNFLRVNMLKKSWVYISARNDKADS